MEELYELAPCGYLTAAPDGTIVRLNGTLSRWLGRMPDELVGKARFGELLSAGGQIYYETHLSPLLFMQGFVEQLALELRGTEGALPVLLSAIQKRDAAGRPALTKFTLFDVSERRRYERELLNERRRAEQEAQARADFAAMVSHEIRTPLSAIMAVAELLAQSRLPPAQQRLLTMLTTSSENLMSLVNDVLDLSKIEAGKLAVHERRVDLAGAVRELAALLRPRAEQKEVALHAYVDERMPRWVRCDRVKLGQVLTNLLGNAIKFTSFGSITLSALVSELLPSLVRVRFEVADTGIGIPPALLPKMFERFTQVAEPSSERVGTGLGLAISQKLVRLLGGELSATSTEGKGSRFSFTLSLPVVE